MGTEKLAILSQFQNRLTSRKPQENMQIDVYINEFFRKHASSENFKVSTATPIQSPLQTTLIKQ